MSQLQVDNLRVTYGDYVALHDVSFQVSDGERLCLLGPSGCGKTTSLRVVAGFVRPSAGTVSIGGLQMHTQPPERRNIGILFQNYALFPHLTVGQNVAFGLRMRGLAENVVRSKVAEALSLVHLSHASNKLPTQLSGGEQQRVAFARAVVIEPSLLLLDEPFSNLDARLRKMMQSELLGLLRGLDVATVMVTHDQEEAMAVADRIAVMNLGRIEQIGTPSDIYSRPATPFVARFIGESNFLQGAAAAKGNAAAVTVPGVGELVVDGSGPRSGPVQIMIRPEAIRLLAAKVDAPRPGVERVTGRVEHVQYFGHRTEYGVQVGPAAMQVWSLNEVAPNVSVGDDVLLEWQRDRAVLFPGDAK